MPFVNKYIIFFSVMQVIFVLLALYKKSVFLIFIPPTLAFTLWVIGFWVAFAYFMIRGWWKDNH